MNCPTCKHCQPIRGHEKGAFECSVLTAGRLGCRSCNQSPDITTWKFVSPGYIRCPACGESQPVAAGDSPCIGYLGIEKRAPAWCPGWEAVEFAGQEVKQQSLFG